MYTSRFAGDHVRMAAALDAGSRAGAICLASIAATATASAAAVVTNEMKFT
jgi:hypothetical protein